MRKTLVAAVASAMTPGCKYDYMLILAGPKGIGKGTFLIFLGQR
jgi:predicted P-loop ATPase